MTNTGTKEVALAFFGKLSSVNAKFLAVQDTVEKFNRLSGQDSKYDTWKGEEHAISVLQTEIVDQFFINTHSEELGWIFVHHFIREHFLLDCMAKKG